MSLAWLRSLVKVPPGLVINSGGVASLTDVTKRKSRGGMFDNTVGLVLWRDKIVTLHFHARTISLATAAG